MQNINADQGTDLQDASPQRKEELSLYGPVFSLLYQKTSTEKIACLIQTSTLQCKGFLLGSILYCLFLKTP